MSLHEAYRLAHTAECRLNMEASRPDRNLRFLVGHLLHYEHLRLRIVEIEHDVAHSASEPSEDRHIERVSAPPQYTDHDMDVGDDESGSDDDDGDMEPDEQEADDGDELSLQRFPSGAAQPPRIREDADGFDDEPDNETLEVALKRPDDKAMADMYARVLQCPCHGSDAPSVDRVWTLPPNPNDREGVQTVVAEVSV